MVTKAANGILLGRSIVSVGKTHGGARFVFVPLDQIANGTVFVPFGGKLQNPFPGAAKAFAGDLFDYRTDDKAENPKLYLLKTYEVVAASGTSVSIARDGFRHIPFVGDKLGVAPAEIGGAMTAGNVIAVTKTTVDGQKVWTLTFDADIHASKGNVLVEADGENNMLVKHINTLTPNDLDFVWSNAADPDDEEEFEDARYIIPVVLGGIMYTHRMSVLPECVKKLNPSKVNGWFVVGGDWGF